VGPRYARAFNDRYGRFGSVFAERFQCRTVDEDGVFDRCGYVLGNPVEAGLCDRVEDWPWSCSRFVPGRLLEPAWTLDRKRSSALGRGWSLWSAPVERPSPRPARRPRAP
jgi:hypothetical protein